MKWENHVKNINRMNVWKNGVLGRAFQLIKLKDLFCFTVHSQFYQRWKIC